MRRLIVVLLIAVGLAACGGEPSNEFGRSDKEKAQELAASACKQYGSSQLAGFAGARGKAAKAAKLDSRWSALSDALSDLGNLKRDVIRTECRVARAK